MNYYISDLHFGHENIIRFDQRPFENVQDMDKVLIENWNATVKNDDTVYILGDFCWGTAPQWEEYLKQLSGKKVLIKGNHDLEKYPSRIKNYFQDITDMKDIRDGDHRIIMSHYPMPFHKKAHNPNFWMFYGHVHNTREEDMLLKLRRHVKNTRTAYGHAVGNFVNVGCMMPWMNYSPRSFEEIISGDAEWHADDFSKLRKTRDIQF